MGLASFFNSLLLTSTSKAPHRNKSKHYKIKKTKHHKHHKHHNHHKRNYSSSRIHKHLGHNKTHKKRYKMRGG